MIYQNRYANALVQQGEYERAAALFERSLQLDGNHIITLNSYANVLVRQGEYEGGSALLDLVLKLDDKNIIALNSYGNLLVKQGKYELALKLFKRAVQIDKNDIRTINNYANALIKIGLWQQLVELRPELSYVRLKYAQQLESQRKFQEALSQLLTIDISRLKGYHANIIRLNLGRLYYRLHQPERGMQLFNEAIANSDDRDKSILYAARSLLANNPDSEEAIDLLRQIQETSPRYAEAMKAIALNANAETAYELFAGDEASLADTEMLYRAMYHKIGNEVAILKGIAYRLLRQMEGEQPVAREIVENLEELLEGISRQRATEKAAIASIPQGNYKEILEIISKTAHDISDEVNNQLAVIESKIRRRMRKLSPESSEYQSFEKLLLQVELTETALNDLKSINEGIIVRRHRFLVRKLFEKWEPKNWASKPRIDGVRISIDIRNSDAEFDGDEEKIKSILNELVENSLKHNQGNPHLFIRMVSNDIDNPIDISTPTIPGDRKFLSIEFTDNGKGVPDDKKEWIFQPLNTTSPETKGSGLGLFIARKTLEKMGGRIREVGEPGQGAKFQIYLPYVSDNLF